MGSGSNFGTDVGQNLLGPFASRKPRQDAQKYQMVNPYQSMQPQQQYTEDILTANIGRPTTAGTQNPFVGPRAEQDRALKAMEGYQRDAEPLYKTSTEGLNKTAGGAYLDPMEQAPFQRLSQSRQSIAQSLFQDAMNDTNARAAVRGNFGSSAREAQLGRQAGRIGTEAAQDIASAGWTQYGKERDLQQQAQGMGVQLAPGLADRVFGFGETIRSAQQAGNTAQMEAQLRAAGLDQNKIGMWLQYMQMAKPQVLPHTVGPSPLDTNLKKLSTEAGAFSNVMGAMGTPGGGGAG